MHLHIDSSDLKTACTLSTWSEPTFFLLVLLNLVEWMHLEAVRIVCASDLCQSEDICKLRFLQSTEELLFFCRLLTVTALFSRLLPFWDTGLAVNRALAKIAIDRDHLLWHNDLLANDTEGVREQIQLVQLFSVLDAIFRNLILWSARVSCSLVKWW